MVTVMVTIIEQLCEADFEAFFVVVDRDVVVIFNVADADGDDEINGVLV